MALEEITIVPQILAIKAARAFNSIKVSRQYLDVVGSFHDPFHIDEVVEHFHLIQFLHKLAELAHIILLEKEGPKFISQADRQ